MSGSERAGPWLGPVETLAQTYCNGLDALFKSYEPAMRGIARVNAELVALAARRAQAWFDVPVSLTKCKTPHEVFSQQATFWQIAAGQYAQGSQRLLNALGACVVFPGIGQQDGKSTHPVRDYMTFGETHADAAENGEPAHGKRRAA